MDAKRTSADDGPVVGNNGQSVFASQILGGYQWTPMYGQRMIGGQLLYGPRAYHMVNGWSADG